MNEDDTDQLLAYIQRKMAELPEETRQSMRDELFGSRGAPSEPEYGKFDDWSDADSIRIVRDGRVIDPRPGTPPHPDTEPESG